MSGLPLSYKLKWFAKFFADGVVRYSGLAAVLRGLGRLVGRKNVIILMYHAVGPIEEKSLLRELLVVEPDKFERQMKWVVGHANPLSLMDAVAGLSGEKGLPSRPVVVTFDDGFRDNLTNALPILKKYNVPATVFASSGIVGGKNERLGLPMLSWDEIREMHVSGIAFGGHTVNHVRLSEVDDATALSEVSCSVKELERQTGEPVLSFAFPYGLRKDASPRHEKMVRDSGAKCNCYAFYRPNRPGADLFGLGRVLINASMPGFIFKNICMGVPFSSAIGHLARKIIGK